MGDTIPPVLKLRSRDQEMVKCADCGFLTHRNRIDGNFVEVFTEYREIGKYIGIVTFLNTENYPLCFLQSFDLSKEGENQFGKPDIVPGEGDITNWPQRILGVIQKERKCSEFRKWQQGFSPKEHREMMDRERLLKYQENQRKEDRKWQNTQQVRLAIIAGIFTIIGALIGVVITLLR
jgi:hypothetical protein